ncbi:MAG: response regulator transcription factor [Halanaerobiales bacterium]|nr:response regulator transcription factor [Halanaerobiales bacterium]
MYKILIVDDEEKIRKIVKKYLEQAKFQVETAADGAQALSLVKSFDPDLLVLDLMLPEISGEEICQMIRQDSNLPILMLTAKSQEKDKITGFNYGADDYLTKPFSPRELVVRAKAILRRSDSTNNKAEVINFGKDKIEIFPEKMIVKSEGKEIDLTTTEFKILNTFIKNTGRVLTREQLVDKVMGLEFKGFDRTIDTHIKNIRKKLSLKKDEYIQTIYGTGYKFVGDKK